MKRRMILAAVLLCASQALADNLADISKQEGFVSIENVLSQNGDKPFECAGYDSASHSCAAISRSRVEGNIMTGSNRVLISATPSIEVQISAQFDLVHGLACGDAGSWKIDVVGDAITPEIKELVVSAVKSNVEPLGRICAGYFQLDGALQVLNFSAETGKRIELIPAVSSTFWKDEPNLRASQ